ICRQTSVETQRTISRRALPVGRAAGPRLRTWIYITRRLAGLSPAALSDGLLGAARRPLDLLERFGEGQQLLVGSIQVDVLSERLPHLVRGRVVKLDPVVFGIEEVDAAGDPVRDRAVDLHALLLEPMVKRPHV